MAEVSRQSTFPPILKSYNPAITASFHPSGSLQRPRSPAKLSRKPDRVHAETRSQPQAAAPPQSKEHRGGRKRGDEGATGITNQQPGSSSGLLTVDKIKREHELELRRKRNQKAEATLMCWDALLEQHRLKKYQTLQQRVGIQRDLISKNDELSGELRRRDEEERVERIQARRSAQKKLTDALRSHIQRIQEHKKKIAEKLNVLKLAEEEQDDNNANTTTEQFHSPVHVGLTHGEMILSDDECEEQSWQNDNATVVYQMLGDDTKLDTKAMLESLWSGKKMAAHRQIRPIMRRSDKLKQVASPSVKQCLEVYEQPTAQDRYTGKPIPLSEVLHEIITKAEMGTSYSNWNNAIELMNKRIQRRAEALLWRRDPYNSLDPALSCNEGWFAELLEEDEKLQDRAASALEKRKRKEKIPLLPKRTKSGGTSLEIKKKLPTFLTLDGDLLTGSLEEFGDQLYCSPSKTTGPSTNVTGAKDEWKYDATNAGSSIFLTDLHSESVDSINLEQKSTTKFARELSEKSSAKRTVKVMAGWQPLSFRALSEHSGVSELPVKGLGHMAHGRYSMWRPDQSCTLGVSE